MASKANSNKKTPADKVPVKKKAAASKAPAKKASAKKASAKKAPAKKAPAKKAIPASGAATTRSTPGQGNVVINFLQDNSIEDTIKLARDVVEEVKTSVVKAKDETITVDIKAGKGLLKRVLSKFRGR